MTTVQTPSIDKDVEMWLLGPDKPDKRTLSKVFVSVPNVKNYLNPKNILFNQQNHIKRPKPTKLFCL